MTAQGRDRLLFLLALAMGALGWWAAAGFAGRREAWDTPVYLKVILPATAVGLALLGYHGSRAAWRWPLLVFGAQLATLIARSRDGRSILPLEVLGFLFLAALGHVPTYLGVALRRGHQRRMAARLAAARRRAEFAAAAEESR